MQAIFSGNVRCFIAAAMLGAALLCAFLLPGQAAHAAVAEQPGVPEQTASPSAPLSAMSKYVTKKGDYFFRVKDGAKDVKVKGNTLIVKGRKCKVRKPYSTSWKSQYCVYLEEWNNSVFKTSGKEKVYRFKLGKKTGYQIADEDRYNKKYLKKWLSKETTYINVRVRGKKASWVSLGGY